MTNTPTKTPLSLDEFDFEAAMSAAIDSHCAFDIDEAEVFTKGALWQYSKDKAVIQELRADLATTTKWYDDACNDFKDAVSEIQTLKAENERLKNPKLKIGQYEIREFHNGNYWIEHESGEAMETAKDKLEACITQYYADNF